MGYIQKFGKFIKDSTENTNTSSNKKEESVKLVEETLGARPEDPALAAQYDQINNLEKQILQLQQQLQAAKQKYNTDSTTYSEKKKAEATKQIQQQPPQQPVV